MRSAILFYTTLIALATDPLAAQSTTAGSGLAVASDSIFNRARQLVLNGNGAAGRVLVDSVIAATTPDTPAYAEALYWRATLSTESSDAERDYRRIIVEYPLSRRTGDALLQLGQLEAARGDRSAASAHLERFLVENPKSDDRAKIGLQVLRLAFDVNDVQRGCTTLGRVLNDVPPDAVEMRNQLAYFSPRCAGVDTTRTGAAAAAPVVPNTDASHKPPPVSSTPVHRDSATNRSPGVSRGKFTLQIAAYSVRSDADALAKKLKGRGLDVRVVGTTKPYRVRVGHYETRAEAAAEAKRLKAKKITGVVTETGADDR